MNYKDGIYAVDSHSAEYDDPDKNVLTWLVCYTLLQLGGANNNILLSGYAPRKLLDEESQRIQEPHEFWKASD